MRFVESNYCALAHWIEMKPEANAVAFPALFAWEAAENNR
jgi:hypothetical protein